MRFEVTLNHTVVLFEEVFDQSGVRLVVDVFKNRFLGVLHDLVLSLILNLVEVSLMDRSLIVEHLEGLASLGSWTKPPRILINCWREHPGIIHISRINAGTSAQL